MLGRQAALALPSFLRQLRRTEIIERVRSDPRTVGDDMPLGVARETAMDAIGWGQADFDEPYGGLSPQDRVLLYAYWNQLGHLEELSEAFRQLFADDRPTEPPIVIDLRCGPFTGGLALAGQIDEFDYIGVDRSTGMQELGDQFAGAVESMSEPATIGRQWAADIQDVHWEDALGWRPVIIIVSFLLASPSLRADHLITQLDQFLSRSSKGPVTVLYNELAEGRT